MAFPSPQFNIHSVIVEECWLRLYSLEGSISHDGAMYGIFAYIYHITN